MCGKILYTVFTVLNTEIKEILIYCNCWYDMIYIVQKVPNFKYNNIYRNIDIYIYIIRYTIKLKVKWKHWKRSTKSLTTPNVNLSPHSQNLNPGVHHATLPRRLFIAVSDVASPTALPRHLSTADATIPFLLPSLSPLDSFQSLFWFHSSFYHLESCIWFCHVE